MNQMEIFKNPEFGTIRAVEIDGEPWLVGKDVALALGYARDLKTVDVGNSIRRRLFDGCHDAYDACKIIYDNLG